MNNSVSRIKQSLEKWLNYGQAFDKAQDKEVDLKELIKKAHRDWEVALNNFNFCTDQDMIDYSIFHIEAAEKRYMCLLKMARREEVTADLTLLD